MSDLKANSPVKFIINDLFDDNEVEEALTKLSAKDWAQFSKVFKIEEQKRTERATKEIFYAARSNTLTPEYLAVRLVCNPDLETKSSRNTPLMWTADYGNTQCLKMLIDAKANIHARDAHERTALHCASQKGHPECVEVLIEAGAEVEAENDDGNTPLITAASNGKPQCLKMLIDAKANIHARDQYEWTALYYASEGSHPECVQVLIEAGAEVEAKDEDGQTPLIMAAFNGNSACMALLLNHGASIWTEANDGSTPMSYALLNVTDPIYSIIIDDSNQAILDIVLEHSPNEHGITALMVAASKGYDGAIPKLLEMGEDPELEDKNGMTALMMVMMLRESAQAWEVEPKHRIIHMLRGDRTNAELNEMRRVLYFPKEVPE